MSKSKQLSMIIPKNAEKVKFSEEKRKTPQSPETCGVIDLISLLSKA